MPLDTGIFLKGFFSEDRFSYKYIMTVFWDDVIVLSMIVSVDVLLFFLKKEHNYCNVTLFFI